MLYSALVPGGGQFYNGKPVKGAVIIGIQGFLIGSAIYHDGKQQHYQKLLEGATAATMNYYTQKRNDYRDEVRNDYWWIGTTLFLSIADAFVDAHLYNFRAEKNRIRLKFDDKLLQAEYTF